MKRTVRLPTDLVAVVVATATCAHLVAGIPSAVEQVQIDFTLGVKGLPQY